MDRVLRCDCGFEARAASDDELAAEVRRHARDEHGMRLSPAQAQELVVRAAIPVESQSEGRRSNVIPYQPRDPHANGCPRGWEALSVDVLLSFGYQAPAVVDANGDDLICGQPWTTAKEAAHIPNAYVPVIFDFRDNDLPPYSA